MSAGSLTMTMNPFNKQDIKVGDRVRLITDDAQELPELIRIVTCVWGTHGNKTEPSCGRSLYASCFEKVTV